MGQPEPRKRNEGTNEALIALIAMAIQAVIVMYVNAGPQGQYWIKLQALGLLHRAAARAARRTGHLGMGDELAGRDLQRYGVAYRMSLARDYLGGQLEAMRP